MPIDASVAVGATLPAEPVAWSPADVMLYHLALGAGFPADSPAELRYVTETDLVVLPTFAVVVPTLRLTEPPSVRFPGVEIDLADVLHAAQRVTLHTPLTTAGSGTAQERVVGVYDKGKAALIVTQIDVRDAEGTHLWTTERQLFVRGEGGFGGDRGGTATDPRPEGEPSFQFESQTLSQQALWYRLLGDRNPLHSDPDVARRAGFPGTILHGLCTYGMVCKGIIDTLFAGQPSRVSGFSARFTGPVFPGERLLTRVWRTPTGAYAETVVPERDDAPALAQVRAVAGLRPPATQQSTPGR